MIDWPPNMEIVCINIDPKAFVTNGTGGLDGLEIYKIYTVKGLYISKLESALCVELNEIVRPVPTLPLGIIHTPGYNVKRFKPLEKKSAFDYLLNVAPVDITKHLDELLKWEKEQEHEWGHEEIFR